jgi:hypothetical protein
MELLSSGVILFSIILTTFNFGYLSFGGLTVLIGLYLLTGILLFTNITKKLAALSRARVFSRDTIILRFLNVGNFTLFLFFTGGMYQSERIPSYFLIFLSCFAFFIMMTYLFPASLFSKRDRRMRFGTLLIIALVLRILMVLSSPHPTIDVFTILQEAPRALLTGHNPYNIMYSRVYPNRVPDYYSYWPVSFLAEVPFIFVFNDPRILLILADLAAATVIYYFARKHEYGELLSLLYLFRPNSNFIIEQSYLSSLEFFFLGLAIILLSKIRPKISGLRIYAAGVVIGLLIGVKAVYILAAIIIILYILEKRKFLTGMLATLFITVVPFILINPVKFKENTIDIFLKSPGELASIPIYNALNINSFFHLFTGKSIPFVVSGAVFSVVLILTIIKSRKSTYGIAQMLLSLGFVFLTLYLFFPHSFINYYYVVGGIFILWAASVYNDNYNSQCHSDRFHDSG